MPFLLYTTTTNNNLLVYGALANNNNLLVYGALANNLMRTTGNPGSVIVPQYGSSKITVFVWGKNIILKFLGNTK